MRALVIHGYGAWDAPVLEPAWAEPQPGPGEVLIDTRAMALNFPDVLMAEGKYQHRPDPPVVAGFDLAGVVLACGSGVSRVAPGDRVLASVRSGAFAERVVSPEGCVWRMPDAMSFEQGAAFGLAALTAHISMIENAGARPGEHVLVTGASGGVGLAMLQYGAACGMSMIAGVTSQAKAALARTHGAAATVDLAADGLHDALRDQVRAIVPEGVDLVMDMVGGDVFDAALRAIRPRGRIAIVGFASGRIPEIRANYLLVKQISAIGSPLGTSRPDYQAMKDRGMERLLGHYRAGRMTPHISLTVPLDDWREAYGRYRDRAVTGKIVMVP